MRDRRELLQDPEEALRTALEGFQAGLWTAMPGIVQSFNDVAMTVEVQPTIRGKRRNPDGTVVAIDMPLAVDVPVIFPSGGGFTLTFPIASGDECLLVFANRCIDAWWQSGGIQEPMEARMHDLSDGFALIGPRSQVRVLPEVSTTNVQLRNDSGTTFVEITPAGLVRTHATDVLVEVQGGETYLNLSANGLARVRCVDLELHASHSYSWDVGGYGQRITSMGGGTYQLQTWQQDAVWLAPIVGPINLPEGP